MRHETIAMEVSPLEFEGIRNINFDAQVDDVQILHRGPT